MAGTQHPVVEGRTLDYLETRPNIDCGKLASTGTACPCPWEEIGETKKVADALTMPVAIGEQDASLWRFQWMIHTHVIDIVQPDLNITTKAPKH